MTDAQPLSGMLRTADEIIAAVKLRKEQIGLSDALIDEIAGYTSGRWSKAFAPSALKCPTIATLMLFCDVLGVSLQLVEDPEKARRMRPRWEGRDGKRIRDTGRIASASIQRALPHAVHMLASSGGKAAWEGTTPEERSERMRVLARKRWAA